jgi:hypothetical protein
MTRSLTVAAVPVLAAEGFARQASEAALLALRAEAWPIVEPPIVGLPIVAPPTVALLTVAGIIRIAERRSGPQP